MSDPRMDAKQPDAWDVKYFDKRIADLVQQQRGFNHQLNRLNYEYEEQSKHLAAVKKRNEELESAQAADMAKIGELSGRLEVLEDRVEKMATWIKENVKKKTEAA
jgi:predicted nuclease with TOPRIM domain